MTMCALVPLNPNELTPAILRLDPLVHAVAAVGTATGSSLQGICGLGVLK